MQIKMQFETNKFKWKSKPQHLTPNSQTMLLYKVKHTDLKYYTVCICLWLCVQDSGIQELVDSAILPCCVFMHYQQMKKMLFWTIFFCKIATCLSNEVWPLKYGLSNEVKKLCVRVSVHRYTGNSHYHWTGQVCTCLCEVFGIHLQHRVKKKYVKKCL